MSALSLPQAAPAALQAATRRAWGSRWLALIPLQALIVTGVLFVCLDGPHRDFHVPIEFSNDAPEYLMQSQGTLENGWWWTHPRLSAPAAFPQVAYPSNNNVEQGVVWLIGRFTRDVGLVLNLAWLVLMIVAAVIATRCLLWLNVSVPLAFVAGVLFSLSPYALAANIDHFSLAVYLVPIPCTAALLVASNRIDAVPVRRVLLWSGCVLLAFDYIYYAFFGVFVLIVASAMALARGHRTWRTGLLLAATVVLATAVNLSPSYLDTASQNRPFSIPEKTAAEADVYGLKLRHLIGPVPGHTFGPLKSWAALEETAHFPLETENRTARLGLIGSFGFLFLTWRMIAGVFGARSVRSDLFAVAGSLALSLVLLAAVGGLGSVFNLLVAPDIRAYSRVFPYVHFVSLLAVALVVDRFVARRWGLAPRRVTVGCATVVMLLGVWDQSHALLFINDSYPAARIEYYELKAFVSDLEARLPSGARVFQLPVASFPVDDSSERAKPYDEAKPYLVSRTLHWSFPAFDDGVAQWQRHVGRLSIRDAAAAVRAEGFQAILIDRFAYEDAGRALLADVSEQLSSISVAANQRFVALNADLIPRGDMPAERLPRFSPTVRPATAGLAPCRGGTSSSIDQLGPSRGPVFKGSVEVPAWRDLAIAGWAVDTGVQAPAMDVDVAVGDKLFATFYGTPRRDVSTTLGVRAYRSSGFMTRIARSELPPGTSSLSLRIAAADGSCYFAGPAQAIVVR